MRYLLFIVLFIGCTTSHNKTETPPAVEETAKPQVDRKEISKAIQSHRKYMSYCYGKTISQKGNAKIKGLTYVEFQIGPDGRGKNPKMLPEKSTLQNPNLNECLFAGITSWDFPVAPDGQEVTVIYPFRFNDQPPTNMQKKLDQFQNIRDKKSF